LAKKKGVSDEFLVKRNVVHTQRLFLSLPFFFGTTKKKNSGVSD